METPRIRVEYFVGDLVEPGLQGFGTAMGEHIGSMLQGKTLERVKIAVFAQQSGGLLHLAIRLQHIDASAPQEPVLARGERLRGAGA